MALTKAIEVPLNAREWVIGKAELMGYLGLKDKDTLRKYYLSPTTAGVQPLLPWRVVGTTEFYLKTAIREWLETYGKVVTGDSETDDKRYNYKNAARARMAKWEQQRREAAEA